MNLKKMDPKIKFCGISDLQTAKIACELQVDYIGLVFFENSPRFVQENEAKKIVQFIKNYQPIKDIKIIALVVNADEKKIAQIISNIQPDYIQFHGDENEQYITQIKKKYNVGVVKVIKVSGVDDLKEIEQTKQYADMILLDSKPTITDKLPGGNAKRFNWEILNNAKLDNVKWLLAGGLSVDNVNQAVSKYHPYGIDVSSGIEEEKGIKSFSKMKEFVENTLK